MNECGVCCLDRGSGDSLDGHGNGEFYLRKRTDGKFNLVGDGKADYFIAPVNYCPACGRSLMPDLSEVEEEEEDL